MQKLRTDAFTQGSSIPADRHSLRASAAPCTLALRCALAAREILPRRSHRCFPAVRHLSFGTCKSNSGASSLIVRRRIYCESFCLDLMASTTPQSAIAYSRLDEKSRPKPGLKFPGELPLPIRPIIWSLASTAPLSPPHDPARSGGILRLCSAGSRHRIAMARSSLPSAISTVSLGNGCDPLFAGQAAARPPSSRSCRMAKMPCHGMAGEWLDGSIDHRLDWFHLNRRIKWLWNAVYHTLGLGGLDAETRFRRYSRALKSIRWNLWHYADPGMPAG